MAVSLERLKGDRKLRLCKIYFGLGFLGLPVLWIVNFVWFFSEAYRKPTYPEQATIKKLVGS
jgi:presenilin enhancer 2